MLLVSSTARLSAWLNFCSWGITLLEAAKWHVRSTFAEHIEHVFSQLQKSIWKSRNPPNTMSSHVPRRQTMVKHVKHVKQRQAFYLSAAFSIRQLLHQCSLRRATRLASHCIIRRTEGHGVAELLLPSNFIKQKQQLFQNPCENAACQRVANPYTQHLQSSWAA